MVNISAMLLAMGVPFNHYQLVKLFLEGLHRRTGTRPPPGYPGGNSPAC
jgi:hypothetical protein